MPVHTSRLARALLTGAGGLTLSASALSGTGQAKPADTGCPAAYQLLSVADLEAQGPYRVPRQLGEDGNRDGFVCGKQTEDHAAANYCGGPCPAQLYNFTENSRTPGH